MLRSTVLFLLAGAMLPAQTPAPTFGKLDLTVSIKGSDRTPIAGARVNWVGPDNTLHTDMTGEDGHLRLSDLPPGVYRLREIAAMGYTGAPSNPMSAFYTAAGNTAVLSAAMIPSAAIAGFVVDEDGKPIPGAIVVAHGAVSDPPQTRDTGITATADAEGHYLINAPATAFPVTQSVVTAYLPIERASDLGKGFSPGNSPAFSLRSGVTENINVRLRSSPIFHLRGSVAPKPESERASVSVQGCGAGADFQAGTRIVVMDDGTFDAAGLVPGTYCVAFEVAQGTGYHRRSDIQVVTIRDRDLDQVQLTPRP